MSTYYYADANNQPVGPCPLSQLQELARNGVIAASTPVIADGDSIWGTYSSLAVDTPQKKVAEAATHLSEEIQGKPQPSLAGFAHQPPPLPRRQKSAGNVQASLEGVQWGAIFSALLLIVIHLFIIPCLSLKKCLADLTAWGRASHLPSTTSDSPVMTFVFVVLRAPLILLFTLVTLLWILSFLGNGQLVPFLGAEFAVSNLGTRIGYAIGLLILGYFGIGLISFIFDCFSLAVGIANNVKKIADRP